MIKIIKGDIIFTKEKDRFEVYKDSYLIIEDGKVKKIEAHLEEQYKDMIVEDMSGKLVIPGFIDCHVHAPQWINTGAGLSKELLPWLDEYTFPLESAFESLEFANEKYKQFIHDLWEVGTTRACVFGTKHKEATYCLIDLFQKSGLGAYVGKVNMDRNAIPSLQEETDASISETIELVQEYKNQTGLVRYIITPRFVPSTTGKLMQALGDLAEAYDLPVQSHLCENRNEVAWVKELHPNIKSFTQVYEYYGLLRKGKTVMAHCVYNTEEEIALLKEKDVLIAHCAQSNFNLASGIMPLRKYMNKGLRVGIASDVGAGHSLDIRDHIIASIQASKMRWVEHEEEKPISIAEAFYLATKGSGSLFGKVGSFEEGYEADLLVIDDSNVRHFKTCDLAERLERFIYTGSKDAIIKRYVAGKEIKEPFAI